MASAVARARADFARPAWSDAFAAFSAPDVGPSLEAADHERRAICAYLVGADDECAGAWEAAQRTALEAGDVEGAARYAFWLGLCLLLWGHPAHAGGWLSRARRLVESAGGDCAAAGYLLVPELLHALEAGDANAARHLAVQAVELGERFDDPDLRAFGVLGHGQALLSAGDAAAGMARLDDVMLSVTAAEVGPITTGIVYCAMILECMRLFDLQRAAEWTTALHDWCTAQPDLVPYRGQCLVHRSQLQQAAGDWREALRSAGAACAHLTDPPHPALGLAYYQEAELHRLRGAFGEAEAGYRSASRCGHHPMPGLALLELARSRPRAAARSIRRALKETAHDPARPALLAAAVEILRASGDLAGARFAADDLAAIALSGSSDALRALAASAKGAVLLAQGEVTAALRELRTAATVWQALAMPYEAARSAVLLGLACSALGDASAAALEFANAREVFAELGAVPDLQRLNALAADPAASTDAAVNERSPLSAREREVLAHVAAGGTNRQVAALLVISEHTVGRHLENIFAKLGVTSRAAATAYAYQHGLLPGPDSP